MSDPAKVMLRKMRDDSPKSRLKGDPDDFYVKLSILPSRRRVLYLICGVVFVAMAIIIFGDMQLNKHWSLMTLPIILLGLVITAVPMTEDWLYKPWQTMARRYERHQIEPWRE